MSDLTASATRPSRRRRILKLLAAAVVLWLLVDKLLSVVLNEPEVGHWRSQAGFDSYRAAYAAAMDTVPAATSTHDVRTDYGTVRVYEWASENNALPVLLLPGSRAGTPMWGENLPSWIGKRTVYALDALGDAGMSSQSVPVSTLEEQAEWVEQTLAGLGLERVHVVGHSFGGATAANLVRYRPERVASLTLLEPVMVLHGLPASTYVSATLMQIPAPQAWKDRAAAEIGGTTIDEVRQRTPVSVMIDRASQHYSAPLLLPRTFTDDEWRSIDVPLHIDIASDKSLAGGPAAARRAEELTGATVTIWPDTTHSLPMQAKTPLGSELQEFWTSHD